MARTPYVFRVELLAVAWLQVALIALPLSAEPGLGASAAELLVRETWYEGLPLDRAAQMLGRTAAGPQRVYEKQWS